MGDIVDDAINIAAVFVKEKEQKKMKKTKPKKKSKKTGEELPTLELNLTAESELMTEIEEGKLSPLLKSQIIDRCGMRREGVMAANDTERALVKETIAFMKMKENINDMSL